MSDLGTATGETFWRAAFERAIEERDAALAALGRVEERERALTEALRFYAEEAIWDEHGAAFRFGDGLPDRGRVARSALAGHDTKTPEAREGMVTALGRVEERERALTEAVGTLCDWLLEHLDGWDVGDDMEWDRQVVASMRCIVTGELGCTEEADYTSEQWAALQVIRAALAGSVAGEECDGSSDCKAATHIHGCFAERPGSVAAGSGEERE